MFIFSAYAWRLCQMLFALSLTYISRSPFTASQYNATLLSSWCICDLELIEMQVLAVVEAVCFMKTCNSHLVNPSYTPPVFHVSSKAERKLVVDIRLSDLNTRDLIWTCKGLVHLQKLCKHYHQNETTCPQFDLLCFPTLQQSGHRGEWLESSCGNDICSSQSAR